ncbi:MAG: Mur ligase family protein [Bacteroidales bacterium]|nr:Mur ligase family protein [Bacteroidales bacterium]MDY6403621.1 Mur ligase family protein [Bacteroidales bacterium]
MKVHFIAIGGSAMHNLAIALKLKGYEVSGSDDEIFSPAKERLEKYNILPDNVGWDEKKITKDLDAIILGMHAKEDNPELIKAKQLGLKIYSYPEFLYEMSKDKKRIVIGGSHGKTTTTAMILHAMQHCGIETDYMVGALLEGFEVMVKMTEEAEYMVLEGDEYLTSTLDKRPKFHLYKPDIAIITGIAWDHINVFPTFEIYKEQFQIFADKIEKNGTLIYCNEDENVRRIAENSRADIEKLPYVAFDYKIEKGNTYIIYKGKEYLIQVFGKHNLMNMYAAMLATEKVGISNEDFLASMQSFKGASKRLELVKKTDSVSVYKDFAHSPSKLKATIEAVKDWFPNRKLVACMELHTFSSLTSEFLQQYKGTMDKADVSMVYYNKHAIELKRLPDLNKQDVYEAFDKQGLKVYTDVKDMLTDLHKIEMKDVCILMMSSGNFDGIDLNNIF